LEYRLQLQSEIYTKPPEAFTAAKIIAKRHELDKIKFGRGNQNLGNHSKRSPGLPIAQSTLMPARTQHRSNENRTRYNNNNQPLFNRQPRHESNNTNNFSNNNNNNNRNNNYTIIIGQKIPQQNFTSHLKNPRVINHTISIRIVIIAIDTDI